MGDLRLLHLVELEWEHRNTPLHSAISKQDLDTVGLLLDTGADLNLHNAYGWAPLHETSRDPRHLEMAVLLIERGARVDECTWPREGRETLTALQVATLFGNVQLMRLLLDNGASINWSSPSGWNLMDLAVLAEDRRTMAFLASLGLSPSTLAARSVNESEAFLIPPPPRAKYAARELLGVATKDRLIPPAELYPIYSCALSRLDGSSFHPFDRSQSSLEAAEAII